MRSFSKSLLFGLGATVLSASVALAQAPTATPKPWALATDKAADVNRTTVKIAATSDHLEADGQSVSHITVRVLDKAGQSQGGVAVTLTTTAGTLRDATMLTDTNGYGYVDTNGNGAKDTDEPQETVLKANREGAWARVKAATTNFGTANKTVLMHRVKVKDFGEPKLISYFPDSNDANLSQGKMTFTIENTPAIGTKFWVTETIYSLEGHDPIATHTEELTSGTYTRNWSDFFYKSGETANGRTLDPGEGIYPFQIEVTTTQVNTQKLDAMGIADKTPKSSDWKASKSLIVKPKTDNAYALAYDEDTNKTYLTYIFDVENNHTTAMPQSARVEVYDPSGSKLCSISNQVPPSISNGGQTFSYYVQGEVPPLETAGDYHFVAEAQSADQESEGKDRGKWALEQNAAYSMPPYVTFGAANVGTNPTGAAATFDTRAIASNAGKDLRSMGYGKISPLPTAIRWWTPNISGVQTGASPPGGGRIEGKECDAYEAFAPSGASSDPVGPLTAQYNAVWIFLGHGNGPNSAFKGRRIHFQQAEGNAEEGIVDATGVHTFAGSSGTGSNTLLVNLPSAYQSTTTKPTTFATSLLINSRLMIFAGCWTADSSITNDLPNTATNLGARCAMGFEGIYYTNEMSDIMGSIMSKFKNGENYHDVTSEVQDELGRRNWGLGGNERGKDENGDTLKLIAKVHIAGQGNSTLRSVTYDGIGEGYRYYKDARWGWQP